MDKLYTEYEPLWRNLMLRLATSFQIDDGRSSIGRGETKFRTGGATKDPTLISKRLVEITSKSDVNICKLLLDMKEIRNRVNHGVILKKEIINRVKAHFKKLRDEYQSEEADKMLTFLREVKVYSFDPLVSKEIRKSTDLNTLRTEGSFSEFRSECAIAMMAFRPPRSECLNQNS